MDLITTDSLHHLLQAWGLWALLAIVLLESVGIPMPGETALISASLWAATTGQVSIVSVIAMAAVGAILGDNIGYLIGRTIGVPLVERYGQWIGLGEARLKVGQYLFLRHGGKIVFLGRFVAFLRAFAALLAGINRMPWPHFLLMNALGGVVWASLVGGGAYWLGNEIRRVAAPVGVALLVAALGLLLAGWIFFRRHERELERRAAAALPGSWRETRRS